MQREDYSYWQARMGERGGVPQGRWSEQRGDRGAPYGGGWAGPDREEFREVYDREAGSGMRSGVPLGRYTGRGPRGYQRSDERIRDDVCEALTQHGHVDASEIDVSVENGEVTLRGTVADRRQKRIAEDALDGIAGIRDVHNQLRISEPASMEQSQRGEGEAGTPTVNGGRTTRAGRR
jgi:hypothetical protein